MIRRPPRSTLFPTRRSSDLKRGVDVVLENVGAQTWKQSLRSLRKGGRLVTCGATTGPIAETDIRIVFWKQIHIIGSRSEEHTSELQSRLHLVCRLLLEKKKNNSI